MRKQDLKPDEFPEPVWTPGSYSKPLNELCKYAVEQTEKAITWYYRSRQTRRYFCQFCRLGAILLTAFAGLLPLTNEIIGSREQAPVVQNAPAPGTGANAAPKEPEQRPAPPIKRNGLHPLWSAIAVAVAGTLIIIDRFYGFTTGWVRYLLTAQQLTQALDSFRLEAQRQKVNWANIEPTQEQTTVLITATQQFLTQMRSIVNEETKVWAAEFAEVLKVIDDQVKLAAQMTQSSGIQITVTNGDQSANGWMLIVDKGISEKKSGKEASIGVLPGIHIVRASGEIASKQVIAEQTIKIGPGEIGKVTLTLA